MFKNKGSHLAKLSKEFIDNLERIKPDLPKYHEVAFSKFVYQFHRTLSQILRTDKNLTLDEMVEQLKNLSSTVYDINKKIKAQEDQLLSENDKKKFQQLKSEIDNLKQEKDYYATIEKNSAKNSLVFKLKDISEMINRLGFSGEQFSKDEAEQVMTNAEDFIKKITYEEEKTKTGLLTRLIQKIKPEKEKSQRESPVESFNLTEKEKNYLKSKVGEEYYNQHIQPIIQFIDSMKGKHSLGEIEKIYKQKYWREGLDDVFKLIYEAMNKKDYADDEEVKEQEIKDAHNFRLTEDEKEFIRQKVDEQFFKDHIQPVINFIDSLNGNYSLGQIEKAYREQVWREEFETTFKLLYDVVKNRN